MLLGEIGRFSPRLIGTWLGMPVGHLSERNVVGDTGDAAGPPNSPAVERGGEVVEDQRGDEYASTAFSGSSSSPDGTPLSLILW